MIVFDFIYFSIYSFVPDKAIFGKRDVACTFFSIYTAMFVLGLFCLCMKVFQFEISIALLCILLFGGLFILTRITYLKPLKFKNLHCRFRKIPLWLLKTIGILYVLFCFASFVFFLIISSLM